MTRAQRIAVARGRKSSMKLKPSRVLLMLASLVDTPFQLPPIGSPIRVSRPSFFEWRCPVAR